MNRMIFALAGAAAVLAVAVMAFPFSGNQPGGVGGQPDPSPIASASNPPPTATPQSALPGDLAPGTYVSHPLPAPDDSLSLTFTLPEGWAGMAPSRGPVSVDVLVPAAEPDTGPPGGMAILFLDVTTLNGDPCDWSGADDDITVGPTVDDLVQALLAQTAYEVSDPVDVTIGGYRGKRVDIVNPIEPFEGQTSDAPGCDAGHFRLWNTTADGEDVIYVQGPADHWHTNILDVDGTRLVIVTRDFDRTSLEDLAEMDAIIESMVIEP